MIKEVAVGAGIGAIVGLIEGAVIVFLGWALFMLLGACGLVYDEALVRTVIHIIAYVVIGVRTFVGALGRGIVGL